MMRTRWVLGRVKDRFVRDELRYRRVLAGLAAGYCLPLNLRHEFGSYMGVAELQLARHFRSLVRRGQPAFDVGAALGYYTVALSRLTGRAPVVAVEADRALCELLERTVEVNGPSLGPVHVVRVFVAGPSATPPEAITLDGLVFEEGLPTPGFVKMDIEGAECEALEGASRLLGEVRPNWIIEVHGPDREDCCRRVLRRFGYRVRIASEGWILREERPLPGNRWVLAEPG